MVLDVALVHAPSVYDFRNRDDILFAYLGNSDSVHVSPIFEMPPVGIFAIMQHLEKCGFNVKFFNVASKMLKCPEFDVEDFFRKLNVRYLGIDLHWLAHGQGALELAKLYKSFNPGAVLFLGGISSTYYHEELINYPQIDCVVRGDDTLLTVEMLVKANNEPEKLRCIPNLTWKSDGKIYINQMEYKGDEYSAYIDWEKVFSGRKNITPYNIVIPQYGCEYSCRWCGGSNYYYKKNMCIDKPVQKTPDKLKHEIESVINSGSEGHTITMINYWHEYDNLLDSVNSAFSNDSIRKIHISLRRLPEIERIKSLAWSQKLVVELSPDSHMLDIAKRCGHGYYSMDNMEEFIDGILESIYAVEIYFLIGIPEQTKESIWNTVDYCEHILKKYSGQRVNMFLCPMLPFLDPGSIFYDNPDRFGYKIIHKSFEDHRQALESMSWKNRLNFETIWLNRDELVEITYDSIRALTLLKNKYNRLPQGIADKVVSLIDTTKDLLRRIDLYLEMQDGEARHNEGILLRKQILEYNSRQFAMVRSQQRPIDFGFAKQQWFDTDEAFEMLE